MNPRNLLAELKRRNVYKVPVAKIESVSIKMQNLIRKTTDDVDNTGAGDALQIFSKPHCEHSSNAAG